MARRSREAREIWLVAQAHREAEYRLRQAYHVDLSRILHTIFFSCLLLPSKESHQAIEKEEEKTNDSF